ncbi:ferritin-like domain-containing protein [Streptomyces sp. NPDC088745]|uniref:ferritin-like domain-containing protein n=1 Tax=Streptomyces sp. NPDC088745 TaxID=3365884 RepID=UPI0037F56ABA
MSTRHQDENLHISEHDLLRLTADMEEAHQATLPGLHEGVEELVEEVREEDVRRREFLVGIGVAAAGMALIARNGSASAYAAESSPLAKPSPYTGDLKVVALAVALENQATHAYAAALKAARAGRLGKVPAAVATFAVTAMNQHTAHAKAWNAVLIGAGRPAIKGVPLTNQPAVLKALNKVTSITDVARLALSLEEQAAQTYSFATTHVTSPAGIKTAASIAPVEAQHAAILHFVLGEYPVQDTFLPLNKAAQPALLTI